MVQVRVSETYDLSTEVDKMGIIGIHTPGAQEIARLWSGLFTNYRYMRLVGCDVTLACASMLPADPLQIGTEAGEIAPQDMFNPILYRAVSNESFNTLQSRIYGAQPVGTSIQSIVKTEIGDEDLDDFNVYYGLLADPDGWKKALPQSGLEMRGLYPIVHTVLNTYGQMINPGDIGSVDVVPIDSSPTSQSRWNIVAGDAHTIKGHPVRMPRMPTKVVDRSKIGQEDATSAVVNGSFPTTYVAMIVTPPAKLHKLYYRMKVTWTIEFEEVRPSTDVATLTTLGLAGRDTYATDYADQSSKMSATDDMVDVSGTTLEKVMVSTK